MKIPFDLNKCTTLDASFYTYVDGKYIPVEILKLDGAGKYPIITYIENGGLEDYPFLNNNTVRFDKDGKSNQTEADYSTLELAGDLDYLQLYIDVEVHNFWINIYVNFITGDITSGKGRYATELDAKNNINEPQNCRYSQTIYCAV